MTLRELKIALAAWPEDVEGFEVVVNDNGGSFVPLRILTANLDSKEVELEGWL